MTCSIESEVSEVLVTADIAPTPHLALGDKALLILLDAIPRRPDNPEYQRQLLLPKQVLLIDVIRKSCIPLVVGSNQLLEVTIGDRSCHQLLEMLSCH